VAEPSKARNVLPRHNAHKKSIQVNKQVSQTWSKPVTNTSQSWNPFKIISDTTDGVSWAKVKAQTQVRAPQMHSNVMCPCCWIWTL